MMEKYARILALILPLILVQPVYSQSSEEIRTLKEGIRDLQQGQSAIKKEISEIQNLLGVKQAMPQPEVIVKEVEPDFKDKVVDIRHRAVKGNNNAKLIFIDVSDYQCSFCGQFVREALPQIEAEYVNTGKIRYVFIDYPIEALHENAFKAALAANCAADQGKFWLMHDSLFKNQDALDSVNLLRYAEMIGLDMTDFKKCFDGEKYNAEIRKELDEAIKIGVGSVPTFLLGYAESEEGKVKVVKSLRGARPYSDYKELIESALSPQK